MSNEVLNTVENKVEPDLVGSFTTIPDVKKEKEKEKEKNKAKTRKHISYGIWISMEFGKEDKDRDLWYDFKDQALYSFISNNYVENYVNNGKIDDVYFDRELSQEEQMTYIKYEFRLGCTTYMEVCTCTKEAKKCKVGQKINIDALSIKNLNCCLKLGEKDSRQDMYEAFLFLYKLGKRYEALADKKVKKKHKKQTKILNEEIEFRPLTGVKYQEAMASFDFNKDTHRHQ